MSSLTVAVDVLGTAPATITLELGTPGPEGLPGTAATIAAGTTTTLSPGSSATVTNVGTSSAAVFNFGIPAGLTGDTGAGVPVGGTDGQVLAKIDTTNYNTTWVTPFAQQVRNQVRNETGATLTAGTVVYVTGASGNKVTVSKAQANGDATSAQTFAVLLENIANNSNGFAVTSGLLENLNTSAYAAGTQLYLSPTVAGTFTSTKPSAPDHLVYVGVIERSHVSQGSMLVRIQNGYELEELHNVAINGVANNELLAYESATDLWKNKSASTLGLLTTSAAASTYAPLASPALTGNPTAPTPLTSDNDTSIATTAFVKAQGYITTAPVTSVAGKTGAVTLAVADVSGAAPLASPALTGTPTAPTATAGTSTTQLATTAFVTAVDILKAPIASPTFTGTPAAPTATAGTSTTQLATTAFVTTADNLKANIASPTFTGVPAAPTATPGTSTTQIATTAFVTAVDILKAPIASPTFTGTVTIPAGASISGYLTTASASSTYQTLSGMSSYLTTSAASSTYYPLSNPSSFITSSALTGYATESWVTSQGYLTDAPSDGNEYVRKNAAWAIATGGGGGLTISSLSNGATSTLDATVPSTGYVLSFDGTNLIWSAAAGSAVWGGITGTVTDQTDLVTYVTGLGYQTSGDVSTYVTGLGYLTDAPSDGNQYCRYNGAWAVNSGFTFSDSPTDGNYYVRMGSTGWAQIGNGTDTIATQNYVTSQGYQTSSDVSTAISGLVTANNARLQAMVESIRAVCNDASYGFDGSGYLYIDLLTGSLNLPVSTSQFSSSGKWFGSKYSGTIYSAMSVSLSSGVVRITFQQLYGWDTGTGLFYTEDGGTTWVESTLKFA
jgi:hypothetical protein